MLLVFFLHLDLFHLIFKFYFISVLFQSLKFNIYIYLLTFNVFHFYSP